MKNKIVLKRKKLCFSPFVRTINVQANSEINKKESELKWYKIDETQAFKKDAKMISRAFLVQKLRRKRGNISNSLVRSKTMCILGLENRINYKRRVKKDIIIQLILKAQKMFRKTFDAPGLETYLSMVSRALTIPARHLATEDGKILSEEVCSWYFPSMKRPVFHFMPPYLTTFDASNRLKDNENPYNIDQSMNFCASFHQVEQQVCKNTNAA